MAKAFTDLALDGTETFMDWVARVEKIYQVRIQVVSPRPDHIPEISIEGALDMVELVLFQEFGVPDPSKMFIHVGNDERSGS